MGDKANDARPRGRDELRVRVVGEGGNLGLTQRGRIEFAGCGGKINTDAIDNSAGVDCPTTRSTSRSCWTSWCGPATSTARRAPAAGRDDRRGGRAGAGRQPGQNVVLGIARAHAAEMLNVHARLITDLAARTGP